MKRIFFLIASFSFIVLLSGCSEKITAPDNRDVNLTSAEKQIVNSSQQFGLKLFKEINKTEGDKNIFISPLSVSTAFGMALNGAGGQTYDDIKSVLNLFGGSQDEINIAYKNLNALLTGLDPKVIFENANSIWYRQNFTFEQSFFDVNQNYFNALVSGLDFSDPGSVNIINNWVNEKTKGKINRIIYSISPYDVMYLINAIYFKGTWLYRFDSTATKQDNFFVTPSSNVTCMMMNQKDTLNYYASGELQAVELPYGNGGFNMVIILPSSNTDINDLINRTDENFLESLLADMKKSQVNLWVPKFELEYKIEISKILIDMGMTSAFDPSTADFTKARKEKDIFISGVLHKTYIKVDEEGTEAAAVTAITVGTTSAGPGPNEIYMRVDHPFVFCIREKRTGAILFIGKVVNPEKTEEDEL